MIWCRFDAAGRPRYGLVTGDVVVPVTGDPFAAHEPARLFERDSAHAVEPEVGGNLKCNLLVRIGRVNDKCVADGRAALFEVNVDDWPDDFCDCSVHVSSR